MYFPVFCLFRNAQSRIIENHGCIRTKTVEVACVWPKKGLE